MSNLSATTRDLWSKTVVDEVFFKLPILRRLMERRQVHFKGGLSYKETLEFDDVSDQLQEYKTNEVLNSTSKTIWATAQWYPKFAQIPVRMTQREWRDNKAGDGQVIPLEQKVVSAAHKGMRIGIAKILYRAGAAARDADCDSNGELQGLCDALTHDIQYGGITRTYSATYASSVAQWFQGASISGAFGDNATVYACNVNNFRRAVNAVSYFIEKPGDMLGVMGPSKYLVLKNQLEAQRSYKPGPLMDYGFTSMMIDEIEIVQDPWLDSTRNANRATDCLKFWLLNLADWHLMLDPDRGFGTFSGLKWQGDVAGGKDEWLGHILLAGNVVCHKPNGSFYNSAWT